MKSPTPYEALKKMKQLSDDNIPFSFSYWSCNLSENHSKGVKHITKAKLRVGLSSDKGIKSESLIGYINLETNQNRWFYIPLLKSFNQIEVQ